MQRLQGRSAVVTGAAQGIGLAIVERLLTEGATVLMVDIQAEKLAAAASELTGPGHKIETLVVDVTSSSGPAQIKDAVVNAFGKVDILVNNAGGGSLGGVTECTDEQWNFALALCLTAPFRVSRELLPLMAAQGYGRVINISSMAARAGLRDIAAYASAKAGVEALTRAIAVDFGQSGVTANAIAPGTIATPLAQSALEGMDPLDPMIQVCITNKPVSGYGKPQDIAGAVAFLASDDARFVTGQVIAVDGGSATVHFVHGPEGA